MPLTEYVLRALKVLLGFPRDELTNQADRIAEVWSSDSQVYEASDNLSEPFRVANLSGVEAKLDIRSRGVETDLQSAIPNLKSILNT